MYISSSDYKSNNINPIDLLEDMVMSYNWPYNRTDNNTLFAEAKGNWCVYHLTLAWSQDRKLLQYSWTYNIKVRSEKYALIYPLINKINLNLPAGHIEVWEDEGALADVHLPRGARLHALACRERNERHITQRDGQVPRQGRGESHERFQKNFVDETNDRGFLGHF